MVFVLLQVDLQLESGEFFLTAEQKAQKQRSEKQEKTAAAKRDKSEKRAAEFVPPVEVCDLSLITRWCHPMPLPVGVPRAQLSVCDSLVSQAPSSRKKGSTSAADATDATTDQVAALRAKFQKEKVL